MRFLLLCCVASLALMARADCSWRRNNPLQTLAEQTCGLEVLPEESGWEGPEECIDVYCLYSKRDFNGGDGVAIITSAGHMREIATLSEYVKSLPDDPPYFVAKVPGKGNGVIAKRKITSGDAIMILPPMVLSLASAYRSFTPEQVDRIYGHALEKLSEPARKAFLDQFGHNIQTKLDKNGFTLFTNQDPSSEHIGIFPHAAAFNHDCRPSIHYRINGITHTTTAARDIPAGEELSISYVDVMLPRKQRLERLREWGFNCTCNHCTMSDAQAARSDTNLLRISRLERDLDSPNSTVTAETGAELVALYEAEKLDTQIAPAYTRAALNFGLFGVEDKAREYARKAIRALEMQYGPKAADIPSMKALQENPKAHWTWTLRKKAVLNVAD